MAIVTNILVSVSLLQEEEVLSSAEVLIPYDVKLEVSTGTIIDACQRSVAYCIDELESKLRKD